MVVVLAAACVITAAAQGDNMSSTPAAVTAATAPVPPSDGGRVINAAPETLASILAGVRPGDTVVLADGTYKGDLVVKTSGTPAAWITIKAAGKGAVIDGGRVGLAIEEASYIRVQGLKVQNASIVGIRPRMGDHVEIRDCVLANNRQWGIITSHVSNLVIENCEAFGAVIEHGIYVANSGDDVVIRNNRIHDNVGNGLHMNGDFSCGGDGVISRALVEGNVVWNNGAKGGSAMSVMHVQDSIFRNNLLYDNRADGFTFTWYIGPKPGCSSRNNQVYNNTVYFKPGEGKFCLRLKEMATGNVVKNNVFVGGGYGAIYVDDSSFEGLVSNNNIIATHPGQVLVGDSSEMEAASKMKAETVEAYKAKGLDAHSTFGVWPKFADPAAGDFHLLPGSAGIDAGADLGGLVPTDIEGTARPQGKAFDCGCYERPSEGPKP